jgi:farnesyl-diphosphate farnesyltransferase
VSFANISQIEQFIESIFPSQQPPVDKKSPASIEEAERKRKEDYEAKWDLIYIIGAVAGTVVFITFLMVCTKSLSCLILANEHQLFVAYLAGARFDIAYTQFKHEFGNLVSFMTGSAPAQATEIVQETLEKSEL